MPVVTLQSGKPIVSIIVPSYNSKRTITRCLQSLQKQNFEKGYEVVVVDSSDDATDVIIRRDFPDVQLIHLPQKMLPGAARNRGIDASRGDTLLFTDADCIVPRDWITQHHCRQMEWDVVGGAIDNANPKNFIGWASYLCEFNGFTPASGQREVSNLLTANVSYKRRLFNGDGFDEDIFPGEDRLFHARISQRVRCLLDRTISVKHINRTRLTEYLRHQARLGRASAQARHRVHLPGSFLVRHPLLITLTPFARTSSLLKRIVRETPWMIVPATVVLPLIILGACAWAFGFLQEAKCIREESLCGCGRSNASPTS